MGRGVHTTPRLPVHPPATVAAPAGTVEWIPGSRVPPFGLHTRDIGEGDQTSQVLSLHDRRRLYPLPEEVLIDQLL